MTTIIIAAIIGGFCVYLSKQLAPSHDFADWLVFAVAFGLSKIVIHALLFYI